jgi:hypothetical protein
MHCASAVETFWQHDPATPGFWNDPLNWTVRVPQAGDSARVQFFDANQGGVAIIDSDCTANTVEVLGLEKLGVVIQESGLNLITSALYIGGRYVLNGGQIVTNYERTYIFTQNGGVNTTPLLEDLGVYFLRGGQLNVDTLQVGRDSGLSIPRHWARFVLCEEGNLTATSVVFLSQSTLSMGFDFNPLTVDWASLFGAATLSGHWNGLEVTNGATAAQEGAGPFAISMLSVGAATGDGTYNLKGQLLVDYEYIGNGGKGLFSQDGGTNTASSYFSLGETEGSTGEYNLNDGQLLAPSEYIGGNSSTMWSDSHTAGTGIFTQNGGVNTIATDMYIGVQSGSGTYNLNDGTNTITSNLYIESGKYNLLGGQLTAQYEWLKGVDAVFTQDGGINTVSSTLYLGPVANTKGTYNLSDGAVSSKYEYIGRQGAGVFTQTGGTNVAATMYLGCFGGSGEYNLNGGSLIIDWLNIGFNGRLNIAGDGASLTINNNLILYLDAKYTAVQGTLIHMAGSMFDNGSTSGEDLIGLNNTTFVFEGGTKTMDNFEVAGLDMGQAQAGFVGNFALEGLTLGGADVGYVKLVDNNDNGNEYGPGGDYEALYVRHLVLTKGSKLDLNGLHLYYQTLDDQGGIIVHGAPIQVIPEPTTFAMILPGIAALAGIVRRRMRR